MARIEFQQQHANHVDNENGNTTTNVVDRENMKDNGMETRERKERYRLECKKIGMLVVSMIISLSSGTMYLFSSYSPQLSHRLHLTSVQTNLIGSSANLVTYLVGPFSGKFVDWVLRTAWNGMGFKFDHHRDGDIENERRKREGKRGKRRENSDETVGGDDDDDDDDADDDDGELEESSRLKQSQYKYLWLSRIPLLIGAFCLLIGYGGISLIYIHGKAAEESTSSSSSRTRRNTLVASLMFFEGLMGVSGSFGMSATTVAMARTFGKERRATIISLIVASFGLSAFFYTSLSSIFFHNLESKSSKSSPDSDSMASYLFTRNRLLLLTIGTSVCTAGGAMVLRPVLGRRSEREEKKDLPLGYDDDGEEIQNDGCKGEDRDTTPTERTALLTTPTRGKPKGKERVNPRAEEADPRNEIDDYEGEIEHQVQEEWDEMIYHPHEDSSSEGEGVEPSSISSSRNPSPDTHKSQEHGHPVDIRGRNLWQTLDFWLLWIVVGILSGCGLMFINNFATMLWSLMEFQDERRQQQEIMTMGTSRTMYNPDPSQSLELLDRHLNRQTRRPDPNISSMQSSMTSLLSICNCLGRLFVGLISDSVAHHSTHIILPGSPSESNLSLSKKKSWTGWIPRIRIHRTHFLTIITLLFVIWTSALEKVESVEELFWVCGLVGFSYGMLFGLSPILTMEFFGLTYMAENRGMVALSPALFGQSFNYLFGHVYDSSIRDHHLSTSTFTSTSSNNNNLSISTSSTTSNPIWCSLGPQCYRPAIHVALVASCIAVGGSVFLAVRREIGDRRKANGSWRRQR